MKSNRQVNYDAIYDFTCTVIHDVMPFTATYDAIDNATHDATYNATYNAAYNAAYFALKRDINHEI